MRFTAQMFIIGDSIIASIFKYKRIWKTTFEERLKLDVDGDHVENAVSRAQNISLLLTSSFVMTLITLITMIKMT